MTGLAAAVGIADHGGWAVLVSVSTREGRPVVLDRRRVELVEPSLPTQPHHHEGRELPLAEAERLIERVRQSALAQAAEEFAGLRAELAPQFVLAAVTLRDGPVVPSGMATAEILASIKHSGVADGVLYRRALSDAAAKLGLEVVLHARGRELALAARGLGTDQEDVAGLLEHAGRELGPPWRKEHRTAAAAAIAALAARPAPAH